jgi:hypothetical protein
MFPIRAALAIFTLAPFIAVHSQTIDQSVSNRKNAPEFRVISTGKLVTFEKELGELAGQGFRLEKILESFTIFYQAAVLSRGPVAEGASARYEYKLLATRRASTLEKELELAANEGYEIRGAMSAGKPYIGSEVVLILERRVGDRDRKFHYRILASPTDKDDKVNDNLQKAVSEGYRPVKVIRNIDVGFGGFVGVRAPSFLVILSRNAGAQTVSADAQEYKVLETMRNTTLEKEINQAAKEGYRLYLSSLGSAVVMTRDKRNTQPRYEYRFYKLKKHAEEADLLLYSQQGYDYCATVVAMGGVSTVLELDSQADLSASTRQYKLLTLPNKEEEKEKFQKEMSEAVAAGFRFIDLTASGKLAALLVK